MRGLSGLKRWNWWTMPGEWWRWEAGSQELSEGLSYPFHLTRYWSLPRWSRESNTASTSYSKSDSPSKWTGGGGTSRRFGMEFGVKGSSRETWKTGWILRRERGSSKRKAVEDTLSEIGKGPRRR